MKYRIRKPRMSKFHLLCGRCNTEVFYWGDYKHGSTICPYCYINPDNRGKFEFYAPEHLCYKKDENEPYKNWYDPLHKGIWLENDFCKAVYSVKGLSVDSIITPKNSGMRSGLFFDIIFYGGFDCKYMNEYEYEKKGHPKNYKNPGWFCFDVKGCNNQRVYMKNPKAELPNKINISNRLDCNPYIAFPKYKSEQLTNPKMWYIHKLTKNSLLRKLSSQPTYKRMVDNSILLSDILIEYKNTLF